MQKLADNIWILRYPLKILGVDIRRHVTVIRLDSGKLLIHSTAPFTPRDVAAIRDLGEPAWVVEAMLDHDTFSPRGHESFPEPPFLAPEGFEKRVGFPVQSLTPPPPEWLPEVAVMRIDGVPAFGEHVFFHHPSGTLIVCDLLFHFPRISSPWAKLLLTPTLGWDPTPAFSIRFRAAIKDHDAFRRSIRALLDWPIRRIVPGHGEVLETDAKIRTRSLFERKGYG